MSEERKMWRKSGAPDVRGWVRENMKVLKNSRNEVLKNHKNLMTIADDLKFHLNQKLDLY